MTAICRYKDPLITSLESIVSCSTIQVEPYRGYKFMQQLADLCCKCTTHSVCDFFIIVIEKANGAQIKVLKFLSIYLHIIKIILFCRDLFFSDGYYRTVRLIMYLRIYDIVQKSMPLCIGTDYVIWRLISMQATNVRSWKNDSAFKINLVC